MARISRGLTPSDPFCNIVLMIPFRSFFSLFHSRNVNEFAVTTKKNQQQ
jgi:hypothetical protein